jgi:HemY protein
VEYLAKQTPDDVEGAVAIAQAAVEAQDWKRAREVLRPYLEEAPSARICTLMARIEGGSGDKGREREWLARALRAPRDRAWIADGYISDRWLPVSPVTGLVDTFEWRAPADAIGRPDETLQIDEWTDPPRDASAMLRDNQHASTSAAHDVAAPSGRKPEDVEPAKDDTVIEGTATEVAVAEPEKGPDDKRDAEAARTSTGESAAVDPDSDEKNESEDSARSPRNARDGAAPSRQDAAAATSAAADGDRASAILMPPRAPDDPGVAPDSEDESEASLERFRSAHIR